MTPLEKVETVKKVVTVFEDSKPTTADKLYILMAVIEMLKQPGDTWHVNVTPLEG